MRDALFDERPPVGVGDDTATEDENVAEIAGAQLVHHPREQGQVGPAEQRQPDRVDIFLQGRLGDLLGCLMKTGVDHLETVIAKRPGDRLGAAVVPVEPGLGDDNTVRPLHE